MYKLLRVSIGTGCCTLCCQQAAASHPRERVLRAPYSSGESSDPGSVPMSPQSCRLLAQSVVHHLAACPRPHAAYRNQAKERANVANIARSTMSQLLSR